MPDTEPTSARLEALRARWEADKGSRVFLQLADEYRRLGRSADAAGVLEEGLRANPTHPAARVLLGRCHLDLGQAAEAITDLEKVLETDSTQMVAYRLLVDAYLSEGRAELARQRLRVYSLLNDSDPEIADLRRRIGELERQGPEAPVPPPGPPPPPAPAGTAEPPEEPPGMSEPPQPPPRETAPPPPPPRTEGEPFPALGGDEGDRRRYLSALDSEGLFAVPSPAEAPEAEEAAKVPEVPETPEVLKTAGVPEPPSTDVFDLSGPAESPPSDLSSLLESGGAAEPVPAPPEEEVAPEVPEAVQAEAEPPAEVAAQLGDGPEPEPEPETTPEPPAAPPPADEEARPAPAAGPGRATVTLGRLYLRQGHLAEAEEIFRQVLEADPDNAEARLGLEELAAHGRPELRAAELLAGFPGEVRGEGLTDRKRYVLERYLQRLRGREPGDVH